MAGVTIRQRIEAPRDKVFSMATDIEKWPTYMQGITRTELVGDGPVGLGTRFRETRIMFKREATEEMEITAFEPPKRYAIGCENHGAPHNALHRVKVDIHPIVLIVKLSCIPVWRIAC